ncbi:MAG TPA: c-type cytochrome [Myxococcales bacterium]|nr:c-type cytochrome [Myxococcales bacterium]
MWLALLLAAAPAEAARAHSLLTYVAADYAAAVGPGGEVVSPLELDEQRIFAGDAARDLRAAGAADLASGVEKVVAKIAAVAAPREVVPLAQALAAEIAQRFHLSMLPQRAPDLESGRALYRQACAACHGAAGTPHIEHLELSTRPLAFASRQEVARLSPQRIYATVTFGVPGTAMPSFGDALDEDARWDLAFAALLFAHPEGERQRGEELLRTLPRRPDWLQLAIRSDDQLRAGLSHSPFAAEDREALISAVRWASGSVPAPLKTAGASRGQ